MSTVGMLVILKLVFSILKHKNLLISYAVCLKYHTVLVFEVIFMKDAINFGVDCIGQ